MRSVIDEIASAEQKAEEIRLAAASEVREAVVKARDDAQSALATVEVNERETAQKEAEAAMLEGERLSADTIQKFSQETDMLCENANARLDRTVSYLVDKVIKTA